MDFDSLRKEAIKVTQNTSGEKWTDYNLHDPGVTIIEQFSFVLTDIAYRTNIRIEDLLFHGDNLDIHDTNALIPPSEIYTPGALTIDDYRILVLDRFVDSVSNCWVEKVINHREGITGLFNMIVHLSPTVASRDHVSLKREIREFYNDHRNLCEDLEEIIFLQPETINLEVHIDVSQETAAEQVVANILFEVENYLNPAIEFRSLEELREEGKTLDEIYDTPSHNHGFIPKDNLEFKRNQFYISKIEEFISGISGVRFIKDLSVYQEGSPVRGDLIRVNEHKYLTMAEVLNGDVGIQGFKIVVHKGGIVNNYRREVAVRKLNELQQRFIRNYKIQPRRESKPKSRLNETEIASYNSVQESFPSVYGVGIYTPPKEEGVKRQAQSNQLKAYLLLFDQLMANHLAQLSKVGETLAVKDFNVENFQTYYTQSLKDVAQEANELTYKKLRTRTEIEQELDGLLNKGELDSKEKRVTKRLKRELAEKNDLIKDLCNKHLDRYLLMNIEGAKKDKSFDNRQINKLAADLIRKSRSITGKKKIKSSKLAKDLVKLMSEELNQEEQETEFTADDLADLAFTFDDQYDRKNRVLSHMLARFGEKFSTDFHLKFANSQEDLASDYAEKRILTLKSALLENIVSINKNRARGISFKRDQQDRRIALERKVGTLLDIAGSTSNFASQAIKALSTNRLTATQTKREKSADGQMEYITTKGRKKDSKVTFIVNSPHFIKYPFQFGLSRTNYPIVPEAGKFVAYFIHPTHEDATRLFEAGSKSKAQEKIETLLKKLGEISSEHEQFRIVEHVLLRPQDSSFCDFYLRDEKGQKAFKSRRIGREDAQMSSAIDTLILGGYPDNYEIKSTEDKDFQVVITDGAGVVKSSSTKLFLTELSAEKYIKASATFFLKQKGNFKELVELDNKTHFNFQFVDIADNVLFLSSMADEIVDQEIRISNFIEQGISSENYEVIEDKNSHFLRVRVFDGSKDGFIQSEDSFRSEGDANRFIVGAIEQFKQWKTAKTAKPFVRFKRIDGRDAKDFNSVVSVVYPNWTSRFNNQEFLQLFEETLIDSTPAHLSLRMVGLNYSEMEEFLSRHDQLVNELNEVTFDNRNKISSLSNEILKLILKVED